jgi:hypothetical protein
MASGAISFGSGKATSSRSIELLRRKQFALPVGRLASAEIIFDFYVSLLRPQAPACPKFAERLRQLGEEGDQLEREGARLRVNNITESAPSTAETR